MIRELEEKANNVLDEHGIVNKEDFYCPNCEEELFDATGLSLESYVASCAAWAYVLDLSTVSVLKYVGIDHVVDMPESYFSDSVLEAGEKYIRAKDHFNFDPDTMECDSCHANIADKQFTLKSFSK